MMSIIGFSFLLLYQCVGIKAADPEDCTLKDSLPCLRYKKTGNDCSPQRLQEQFPLLYERSPLFPGRAGAFNGDTGYKFYKGNNHYTAYMYVNLTFMPPSNAAKNNVRGFEVTQMKSSTTTPTCYIYDMSNATWDASSFEEYSLTNALYIWPLQPGLVYTYELYTLPKPVVSHDENNYLDITFNVPINATKDWVANISKAVNEEERIVMASFEPAHPAYKFTAYRVQLIDKSGKGREFSNRTVQSDQTHDVKFYNVPPGNYSIWVRPSDPFYYDIHRCLCKLNPTQCQQCLTTSTSTFEVEDIPQTTKLPGAIVMTEGNSKEQDLKIAGAVVGSILGVAIVVVFVVFLWMRRRRLSEDIGKGQGPHDNGGMDTNQNKIDDFDGESVVTVEQLKRLNNIQGCCQMKKLDKIPKLFVLFEEDHQYHKNVVDMFATYLQQHCHCKVMNVEWMQNALWAHQEMQGADYRVVINSQASYLTYKQSKLSKASSGNTETSINSIHKSFLCDERYDNTVMVYFDYTSEEFIIPDICPGYKYKMMKNFPEFLMHIHKIKRTDNMALYDLPLDGNHNKRPIGQKLMDAIAQASNFERENPMWAQRRFGVMRSTSDESQYDSGLPDDAQGQPAPAVEDAHQITDLSINLNKYLGDLDMITISPSMFSSQQQQQQPQKLEPLKFSPYENEYSSLTPPTGNSNDSGFDFVPPEDDEDFDSKSKTQSEQLGNINDHYAMVMQQSHLSPVVEHPGYNRNSDLHLLQLTNPDLTIGSEFGEDSKSLGGVSV